MALASLCTTIASDKIHLIKNNKIIESMKKILSILRGKKQTERLSELRSQEIMRALDSALNNVEEQKVLADIRYHEEINNLGDDGVNYKSKINQLIEYKETIVNADNTIQAINEIKNDLESEVEDINP